MCGVYGELRFTARHVEVTGHARMAGVLACLRHRGPDSEGSWQGSGQGWHAALAHTRLKIIDLSDAGAQPMVSPSGRFTVAFNGEIYNYREVRSELARAGVVFRSASDTEVLAAALEEWGERAIPLLEGMFAFVAIDNTNGHLLAARDAFGVKPIYYTSGDWGVALASEVRCLDLAMGCTAGLSAKGVASFLGFGSVYGPGTLFDGITELLPGHLMRVEGRRIEVRKWYDKWDRARELRVTTSDSAAEVRDLLRAAIERQLVSDVPVSIFLSGGMDSQALVALAARARSRAISAITVDFEESPRNYSEGEAAGSFASNMGIRHQILRLSERWIVDSLDSFICALDQPTLDGANTWAVSRAAKAAGVSVALSGLGGDEVFGGYGHLRDAKRWATFYRMIRVMPGVARGAAFAVRKLANESHSTRKMAALLGHLPDKGGAYAVRRALFLPEMSGKLVMPDVARAWQASQLEGMMQVPGSEWPEPAQEATVLEFCNYLPFTLLRDTDVLSMAHGLEVRVPFLDRSLVEYVLDLPLAERFDGRTQKPLLARAVPEIARSGTAKKIGFTLPFSEWLRGPLRAEVRDRLSGMNNCREWINAREAVRVLEEFLGGQDRLWTRVWALFVLERWAEENNNRRRAVRAVRM